MTGYYGFKLVVRVSSCSPPVHVCRPLFSFPGDNSSKCQWIFTKLRMCIDIVEIWFGNATGQISSFFDSYLPATR